MANDVEKFKQKAKDYERLYSDIQRDIENLPYEHEVCHKQTDTFSR